MNKQHLAIALSLWIVSPMAMAETAPHTPALPDIPAHVFKVTDHGAAASDQTDNTKAIQATIDAANAAGGGTVEIPAGEFLSGPLQLASKINLQVDDGGVLTMLPLERYPGGTQDPKSFINAQ